MIGFVHGLADVETVFVGDVMILSELLVFQEIGFDLFVEVFDALVEAFLLFSNFVIFSFELIDVFLDLGGLVASDPLDGIFLKFLYVIDAFEDVGDVINSSFLYFKFVDSFVKVDSVVLALLDEFDELFGEY